MLDRREFKVRWPRAVAYFTAYFMWGSVFSAFDGLTKVMFVSNISDTTTPSLPSTPKENTEIATQHGTM